MEEAPPGFKPAGGNGTCPGAMEPRLVKIFAELFNVPAAQVTDALSPESVKKWDSMGHLTLVQTLEAEFELTFEEGELTEMDTVGHVKDVLRRHGVT